MYKPIAPILDHIVRLFCTNKVSKDSQQTLTTTFKLETELQNKFHNFIDEYITHPDPKEKSTLPSYCKINGSIIEIEGFNKEKLSDMCYPSKIPYGNDNVDLFQAWYKIRREFYDKGYRVNSFYYHDENRLVLFYKRQGSNNILPWYSKVQ